MDNYSLMKNADRFLATYDDCCGDDAVDETVQTLQALKEDGYYIYYMVADYKMADAVWRSVLTEYLNAFREDSKVLLVVETGSQCDDNFLTKMTQIVEAKGNDAPIVVTHQSDDISKALLRVVDTYITTKDESSSVVVDLLWDMDAEIVYGLDYGGKIFCDDE